MKAFDYGDWQDRISKRIDITGMVTHLTKPSEGSLTSMDESEINLRAVDTLIKILKEKKIQGSNKEKGFINGDIPAVCFQEVPFFGLVQNVEFEKERRSKGSSKIRYCGVGLSFNKFNVFENCGRPVIYEETERAKQILPENQYWRIVNLELHVGVSKIVDWTHEREWRLPGDFNFRYDLTHVVLYDKACLDYFRKNCSDDIVNAIHGITMLKGILM
ncbi:hypothetical protein JCM17380_34840 [Desulfosporosinus burensis]